MLTCVCILVLTVYSKIYNGELFGMASDIKSIHTRITAYNQVSEKQTISLIGRGSFQNAFVWTLKRL